MPASDPPAMSHGRRSGERGAESPKARPQPGQKRAPGEKAVPQEGQKPEGGGVTVEI